MTIASALLLTLSQSPLDLGFMAPGTLVPWLLATRRAGYREALFLGICLGVVHGLTAASWLVDAFESLGASGLRRFVATLLTVFWAKGASFGVMGLLARALRGRTPGAQALAMAVVFAAGESWMSESRGGLPLLLMGHSQASVPGVAQLAVAIGVPGISALLFASNAALASLVACRPGSRRLATGLLAMWCASAALGIPLATLLRPIDGSDTTDPARERLLLVVQPSGAYDRRWKSEFQRVILDEIAAQTSAALKNVGSRPDLILWPENLLTSPIGSDAALRARLRDHVDTWNVPVLTGLVRTADPGEPGRYRSSSLWWAPDIGPIATLDKVRAVPFVESSHGFPGRFLLSRILGGAEVGPRVSESDVSTALRGDFAISPVLCFEVLFPRIVAERRSSDSAAIVNLADDSWVPGERADRQLIAAALFRAIEQRLTLVRVSHSGLSVVIDAFGREIAVLPPDVDGHLLVRASPMPLPTVFERVSIVSLPTAIGILATLLVTRGYSEAFKFSSNHPSNPSGRSTRPGREHSTQTRGNTPCP